MMLEKRREVETPLVFYGSRIIVDVKSLQENGDELSPSKSMLDILLRREKSL